jgi:hypothetical protein
VRRRALRWARPPGLLWSSSTARAAEGCRPASCPVPASPCAPSRPAAQHERTSTAARAREQSAGVMRRVARLCEDDVDHLWDLALQQHRARVLDGRRHLVRDGPLLAGIGPAHQHDRVLATRLQQDERHARGAVHGVQHRRVNAAVGQGGAQHARVRVAPHLPHEGGGVAQARGRGSLVGALRRRRRRGRGGAGSRRGLERRRNEACEQSSTPHGLGWVSPRATKPPARAPCRLGRRSWSRR